MRSLMTKSSTISCACCFGERARRQVALEVDVEEGRRAAQRHRGAVLFLHGGQIAEVEPLHGFARVGRWTRDVEAVAGGHLLQFLRARGSAR